MAKTERHIFLHFIWATRARLPFVTPEIERRLYRMIEAKVGELNCVVVALNGMPDHVHLLALMATHVSPAELMQKVKGASSGFARNTLRLGEPFSWQHGYGVFSVGQDQVPRVVAYIQRQKQHHGQDTTWPHWETIPDDAPNIPNIPNAPERSEAAEARGSTAARSPCTNENAPRSPCTNENAPRSPVTEIETKIGYNPPE